MAYLWSQSPNRNANEIGIFQVYSRYIPVWTGLMLLIELGLSLVLHLRQLEHLRSLAGEIPLLDRYGGGMYTRTDLELRRKLGIDRIWQEICRKIYIIFAWLMVFHFHLINSAWTLARQFSPAWPAFLHPDIAWNMSFALVAFVTYQLFKIPIILHAIFTQGRRRNDHHGDDVDYSQILSHMKVTTASLLPVGILAGLDTAILQTLGGQTLSTQLYILGILSCFFVLSYPTLEVWYTLQDLKTVTYPRKEEFGEQKHSSLHDLCDLVGFPKENLVITDNESVVGSSASTFYFGFLFYQRIAIFCNAPLQTHYSLSRAESESIFTENEVESLLAHELGHWYDVHSDKAVLLWHTLHISTVLLTYWLHSSPTLLNGFGFRVSAELGVTSLATFCLPGVIIAYCLILRPYYYILEAICNLHQQSCEREADRFAASLGYGTHLARSLIKLELKQNRPPSDDRIYSMFHHKHPCLVERLKLLRSTSREFEDT